MKGIARVSVGRDLDVSNEVMQDLHVEIVSSPRQDKTKSIPAASKAACLDLPSRL